MAIYADSAVQADVKSQFDKEMSLLSVRVLRDDGLYRHVSFRQAVQPCDAAQPYTRSWFWFDLITVPGTLVYQGDGDAWVFRRVPDMFEFFRARDINPGYWAEKLVAGQDRVCSFSPDVFRSRVRELTVDAIRDRDAPPGLGRAVQEEILRDPDVCEFEDPARLALDNFEHSGFRFYDTFELSFDSYNRWFLWSCYAIWAGVRAYDLMGREQT